MVESDWSEQSFGGGGGQLVQLLSHAHAGDVRNRLTPLSNYHKTKKLRNLFGFYNLVLDMCDALLQSFKLCDSVPQAI